MEGLKSSCDNGLIFDVGLHRGEDTEFYLKKGFRVVAIEASEALCREAEQRLSGAIAAGRLTIINRAVAATPGEVTFFENAVSVWGTVVPSWAERNLRLGAPSIERKVQAVTLGSLIAEFGIPYYLKIDIEGMDRIALEALTETATRPKYVSIESEKISFT